MRIRSRKKLLWLGYQNGKSRLPDFLSHLGFEVTSTADPISDLSRWDHVVSFGYRHILSPKVISSSRSKIINLHMSYLPYNRGAHSNFWSFYDQTPAGISIHLIDSGIDTGPILMQRRVEFSSFEVTFEQTYQRLFSEIELLFEESAEELLGSPIQGRAQSGVGSYHSLKDLPLEFSGWDSVISDEIPRLKKIRSTQCGET